MDHKTLELLTHFASTAANLRVGDRFTDAAEFTALDDHITDMLTEATQRGVQVERKRWKGRISPLYGNSSGLAEKELSLQPVSEIVELAIKKYQSVVGDDHTPVQIAAMKGAANTAIRIERDRQEENLRDSYERGRLDGMAARPIGEKERAPARDILKAEYERGRDDVLSRIERAGQDEMLDQPVRNCIATSWIGADPERDGFALEMATQYGFIYLDDDAEILGVTAKRLADMMSVLGFRRGNREPSGTTIIKHGLKPGYGGLLDVLLEALNQAQYGKGAERHNLGGETPFERQRMQTISELIGSGDGMTYQIVKKVTEGVKLPTLERQVAELLGAINYLAGLVIYLRKQQAEKGSADKKPEPRPQPTAMPRGVSGI